MQLPSTFRDSLVEQLDDVLSAYDTAADPEIVAGFLIEFVEAFGDENAYDDIIDDLEDTGNIDGSLTAVLEAEFESSDMDVTAEEAVSIFERICGVEWSDEMDEPDDNTEDYSVF